MRKILLPLLLFALIIFISELVVGQSISINSITPSGNIFCFQSRIEVVYSTTGSYNSGNQFKLQIQNTDNNIISDLINQTDNGSKISGNFPPTSITSYKLRLVSTSPIENSNWIPITIRFEPSVTISGTTTICEWSNAIITFTNNKSISTTATYNINGGTNQQITVGANSNATVGVQGIVTGSPYVYNLVSAQYSNSNPSCPTTITGSATVTVKRTPTATISGSGNICEGLSKAITFTNPHNFAVDVVYKINNGVDQTITVPGNNSASVNQQGILAGSPFVYSLQRAQYSTSPNCQNTITGAASISVKSAPQIPVIDWNGIQLSTNLTGVSYQWYLNNNMINGANASTYTPTVNGNYKLIVTANGCSTSSQDFILTATSVSSLNPGSDTYARIYPNPAQNYFVISLNKLPNTVLDILILNSVGMGVKTLKSNSRQTQLNIEDLPSGAYLIKIKSANYTQINKVEIFK